MKLDFCLFLLSASIDSNTSFCTSILKTRWLTSSRCQIMTRPHTSVWCRNGPATHANCNKLSASALEIIRTDNLRARWREESCPSLLHSHNTGPSDYFGHLLPSASRKLPGGPESLNLSYWKVYNLTPFYHICLYFKCTFCRAALFKSNPKGFHKRQIYSWENISLNQTDTFA